jgi:Zn finger protein HypA/HybF involved in hydrogenase expression
MAQRCTYCGKTRTQHRRPCVDVSSFKAVLLETSIRRIMMPCERCGKKLISSLKYLEGERFCRKCHAHEVMIWRGRA